MTKFMDDLTGGLSASAEDITPGRFSVAGDRLVCRYCEGDEFEFCCNDPEGMTLPTFSAGWINRRITTLMCCSCGLLASFGLPVDRD